MNSVVPAAARAWKRAHRSWRSTGSRPTVGSSRTSKSGVASRAQARETLVRSPPDSVLTFCAARSASPTSASVRSAVRRDTTRPRSSGRWPGPRGRRRRRASGDVDAAMQRRRAGHPEHRSTPVGRPAAPRPRTHQCGLAAAARPQPGDGSAPHRQRDPGEHEPAAARPRAPRSGRPARSRGQYPYHPLMPAAPIRIGTCSWADDAADEALVPEGGQARPRPGSAGTRSGSPRSRSTPRTTGSRTRR